MEVLPTEVRPNTHTLNSWTGVDIFVIGSYWVIMKIVAIIACREVESERHLTFRAILNFITAQLHATFVHFV